MKSPSIFTTTAIFALVLSPYALSHSKVVTCDFEYTAPSKEPSVFTLSALMKPLPAVLGGTDEVVQFWAGNSDSLELKYESDNLAFEAVDQFEFRSTINFQAKLHYTSHSSPMHEQIIVQETPSSKGFRGDVIRLAIPHKGPTENGELLLPATAWPLTLLRRYGSLKDARHSVTLLGCEVYELSFSKE